jgi:hypothetical protein
MRESVKGDAVHGNENGSEETRLQEEFHPMYVVVIGHGSLNYPTPLY